MHIKVFYRKAVKWLQERMSWRPARRQIGAGAVLGTLVLVALCVWLFVGSADAGTSPEIERYGTQASILATVASSLLLLLTTYLLFETITLREQQNDPDLAVYLAASEGRLANFVIVIHNLGSGAAYDVRLSISPIDAGWIEGGERQYFRNSYYLKNPIPFLAPGAQKRIVFGSLFLNSSDTTTDKFDVLAKYRSEYHRPKTYPFSEQFPLDMAEFDEQYGQASEDERQTKALESISKSLSTLAKRRS